MDIHLDTLLRLPNVSVFTCYQKEGFIYLSLLLLEFRLISQVVFFLKIQSIQPTTSSVIFDLV
jgi:hypothetical protein